MDYNRVYIFNTTQLVNLLQVYVLSVTIILSCCFARDTIELDTPIKDIGETLVSAGERFELGFFTPNGSLSGKRYVGIWYKSSPNVVVWVANRDNPLPSSAKNNGVFGINDYGNLQVWDESNMDEPYWSTEIGTTQVSLNLTAKLFDSGNLMLGDTLWESFKNATDTFLPGMKMESNFKLVSWRGKDDPASGNFSFQVDNQESEARYIILKNQLVPYWKSGGKLASSNSMPAMLTDMLANNLLTKPTKYFTRNRDFNGTRLVVLFDGTIAYQKLNKNNAHSDLIWSEPADRCSIVNACGDFSVCNAYGAEQCKCLPGYKEVNPEKWSFGDFSGGCTRRGTDQCGGETFMNFTKMNVKKSDSPDYPLINETECMKNCLNICPCTAYSFQPATFRSNSSCSIWILALHDVQENYTRGRNLSVRIALSDLRVLEDHQPPKVSLFSNKKKTPFPLVIGLTVLIVVVMVSAFVLIIIWRRKQEKKRSSKRSKELFKLDTQNRMKNLMNSGEFAEEEEEGIDVPFFNFDTIIAATDNFSENKKLGQGGYGPVYKGTFQGGQEIAVKRLSSASGQGLQEFKNEVVLIARLQHRNLVRLRGYCVKKDEKILLYEYMPNKSLDSFVFDQEKSKILDWAKRFNIILGIARGLLYLHQDSRLRIIHRDLKTGNFLLDQDMEPKISDFGLARIFGGKQTEANTERVVGTYGYMSPEYALEGLFSVKSDVFSFGVVLLEIISGKRNTRLVQLLERPLSLLGYAWRLWTENSVSKLMDPTLVESCDGEQFMKCVKIALLCVQEDPSERPNMSAVMTMLDGESANIPNALQPAFVLKTSTKIASSTKSNDTQAEITVTLEQGR